MAIDREELIEAELKETAMAIDREELIEALKELLKVEVSVSTQREYGDGDSNYLRVTVELKLDGETISTSRDYGSLPDNSCSCCRMGL